MRSALLLVALLVAPAHAAEVAGVKIEDRVTVESSELALNGAGLRTKFFVNVYAAGLYLAQKKTSASECSRCPARSACRCA